MLKTGLAKEFYQDIKTALVPFTDPVVYGRSTLENSSFIASSANPDPSVHGRGFVARLSGSTVEFLNMWFLMFVGKQPFVYDHKNDVLGFQLQPILPKWLFRADGTVTFTLFSNVEVTYVNASGRDTFGENSVQPVKYTINFNDGKEEEVSSSIITGKVASSIREGDVAKILVELN